MTAALLVVFPTFVSAQDTGPDSFRELESNMELASHREIDSDRELDSKFIFGFTVGSDIGPEGELELASTTGVDFQKRGGSYGALEQEVDFDYNPTDSFEIEAAARGVYHSIRGVEGLDDHHGANFRGMSSTFRYLLIGRGPGSPIGLQIAVEPEWSRIDSGGKLVTIFEAETRIIADTELVPDRLFAAFNAIYVPEIERQFGSPNWARASTLGLTTALTYRITPKMLLGGELEYFRAYEGIRFNTLAGDALFAGPTLHIQVTNNLILSAAFSTQIAGHAAGDPSLLDLTNFSRKRAFLRLVAEF
jgi:hypothetical protein